MARISNYDNDATVSGTDKVIGTDSSTTFTKNFRVIDLAEFFFSSLSGDVSVDSSGVVSVSSVGTLGSNSGNYVATLTARNGITSSGATSGATVNHILDVNSTQTHITSILNAGLCIGRDSDNKICFTTDNEIRLTVNGVLDLILAENALTPGSSDGTALGTTSLMWSDLFLASGAIINFNNGNLTLTHSSNALTLSGSDKLQFGDDATYIHQSADSVLDLVSDGELELNATTEVEINTALVDVNASGAVTIDAGGNSNITVTGSLDVDASAALTIDSDTSIGIGTSADKPIDIDSTTLDIDASDAVTIDGTSISIDGNTASNLTVTGSGESLTLEATGGGTQQVVINSAGTSTSAVDINATAGGIDIDASGALAIDSATSISIGTNADKPVAIDSTTFALAAASTVVVDGTGISIDGILDSNFTVNASGQSLNLTVSGGGTQVLSLDSAGTGTNAIDINATGGGVDIVAAANVSMLAATSFVAQGNNSATFGDDTEQIAYDGSGNLDIDAVALDLDSSGAINILAAGNASDITIKTEHVAGTSFHLDANSDVGSIVDIDAGILNIASDGLTSMLSASTFDIDAAGAVTIDGSSITIGADDTGVAISIGHTTSETTVNDNLNVTGTLKINAGDQIITFPTARGSNNQVLKTNGSGVLSFGDPSSGVTVAADTTDSDRTVVFANGNTLNDDHDTVGSSSFKYNPNDKILTVNNIVPKTNAAGDIGSSTVAYNDLFLSNGGVIEFIAGSGNRVQLTHIDGGGSPAGDPNDSSLRISSKTKLEFNDSAVYIASLADGHLDLVSDAEVQIVSPSLNFDGAANISGNLVLGARLQFGSTTFVTEIDNSTSLGSDDHKLATQKAIKTYVDAQITLEDLDVTSDSGTIDIDLNSETLDIAGGNAISTSASGTTVTINHDDTSSQSNVNNSGSTFVQDLTFDTYGHVTGVTSVAVPTLNQDTTGTAAKATVTAYTSGTFPIVLHNDSNQLFDDTDHFQFKKTNSTINDDNQPQYTLTLGETANYAHYLHGGNIDFKSGATISTHDAGFYIMGNAYYKLVSGSGGFVKKIAAPSEVLKLRDQELTLSVHTSNGDTSSKMTLTEVFSVTAAGNLTVTGELDGATLDISGNADISGSISSATWTGDVIAEGYLQNQSGTNTGDETLARINALDVTELGTISSGVWQGSIIAEGYLQNQSGTNTGDETLARINALDVTELGTVSSGVWQGSVIAEAYLQNQSGTNTGDQTNITGNSGTFTVTANNSNNETVYPIFVDGATGSQGAETDTGLFYNPSTGKLTSESLSAKGGSSGTSSKGGVLNLSTKDTAVLENDILGTIEFQAPDEANGGDSQFVAAEIRAVAEESFTNTQNDSKFEFLMSKGTALTSTTSPIVTIASSGIVTGSNFAISSDKRLKSEIEPIKEGLEVIKQFTSYNYIKGGKKESGFIAQEVQEVIPHTVYEDKEGMLSMSDRGVVAHMHKAILELEKRLISIEEKLK